MMAGRLKECLKMLRWSEDDLAEELGCPSSEVQAWFSGGKHPPLAVAAWIEALVKAHRSVPAPNLGRSFSGKEPTLVRSAQIVLPHEPPGYSASRPAQRRSRRPVVSASVSSSPVAPLPCAETGSSHATYPL